MPASFHHAQRKTPAGFPGGVRAASVRPLALALTLVAALTAPVVAAPDDVVTDRAAQALPDQADTAQAPRTQPLPPLRREMARFDPQQFLQERRDLTAALHDLRDRLNSAIRPSPIEVDMLLDLAALHLSQRMLPEARSFLAALPVAGADGISPGGARLSPIQQGRATVLAAALAGFAGAADPVPEGWPDAPLFDALGHIARKDHEAARPLLEQAVRILNGYPAALSDPIRPQLLWAAIEGGAWDVARDLAGQMRAADDQGDSTAYLYLMGRAAEVGGDMVAAFDNHAAAAAGTDEWAQRARLALIDLGRATRTLSAEDARQLLTQTRAIWQGGEMGLATLLRLAALELTDRRDLPALEVLSDIIRLYPGTREATASTQRAWLLIEALYARGLDGDMPLSDFVAAHRAIAADFRFDPAFDPLAEAFADHLAASGASGLAAAEYRDLRARVGAVSGPSPDDGAADDAEADDSAADDAPQAALDLTRDRLRLKEAAALMQGGQLSEAETLLATPLAAPDKETGDRYNLMRAQLFAATARHADVLATRMAAPSGDYLRLRANAAFELSEWDAARDAYEQLWRSLGSAMPTGDRINLLLATHRSGDPARLQELIQSFPDLGANWTALAAGLNTQAPDVLPLRGDAARARVENADSALRLLQAAGGDAMQ